MSVRPTFPGLQPHHDVRNERWLLRDALPIRRSFAQAGPQPAVPPFVPRTRRHRQYRRYTQLATPKCTGAAPVTMCATAHPFNPPPISLDEWYALNQKRDREVYGLFFDEGATVTSSLETGRQLGIFTAYRWAYDLDTMQRAILDGPMIAGTAWPDEMFERDREGIVVRPDPRKTWGNGHEYVLGGYLADRGLWRVHQTWDPLPGEETMPGQGWDWFIPDEVMHELVRREGEIAQIDEVRLEKDHQLAPLPE